MDATKITLNETFDYVVLADIIGLLSDIQKILQQLHKVSNQHSRIIITYYNYLWQPILRLAEAFHLKKPAPWQNWVSPRDLNNFLYLTDFEIIKQGRTLLLPVYIPIISTFVNRYLAKLPLIQNFCLVYYLVVRQKPIGSVKKASVSVIVPCRNEAGNIETLIKHVPKLGSRRELIFVEGNSSDNTWDILKNVKKRYPSLSIRIARQQGKGKGSAVREGFAMAKGDVLMILDADMTVPPKELSKFYKSLLSGKGELINGSRLVYPLKKDSMRLLNLMGNKFFSLMFSWLLGQSIKDTLCGTKVLWKKDYERIKQGRAFFGDFDPFGDFDLLFGAAKLNLKIVDLPIRYQERTYGTTNISRFQHGWLLLKMCLFAMRKIKFI